MSVRTIHVHANVMARNDEYADRVRRRLADAGVIAFNMISSPGSGKTMLLERTLERLDAEIPIAVVTGDLQTENDARRLERHTGRLVQAVVTDGGCHLDARQIHDAVGALDLAETRLLFVENVGNLVCPAAWDLGEAAKIVVLSVTEGEDKPIKYPTAFQQARYAVFNKIDLLPHLDFDLEAAAGYARDVNPDLETFFVSARTGEGMDTWYEFLRTRVREREAA